jgi:hypothetical protein
MVILGLALKVLGPGLRSLAMALLPVAAVLGWGAVQQGLDNRKNHRGGPAVQ